MSFIVVCLRPAKEENGISLGEYRFTGVEKHNQFLFYAEYILLLRKVEWQKERRKTMGDIIINLFRMQDPSNQ